MFAILYSEHSFRLQGFDLHHFLLTIDTPWVVGGWVRGRPPPSFPVQPSHHLLWGGGLASQLRTFPSQFSIGEYPNPKAFFFGGNRNCSKVGGKMG